MRDKENITYAVYGERSFRDALKLVASQRNSNMSRLIHEAVMLQFGKEISEMQKIFVSKFSDAK